MNKPEISPPINNQWQCLTSLPDALSAWERIETAGQKSKLDFYFHPGYIWLNRLSEKKEESTPRVFFLETPTAFFWYPLLIRKIPAKYGVKAYDATSAYGFGGPLMIPKQASDNSQRERQDLLASFSSHWETYCAENVIVAEFIRFHPLLENHRDLTHCELHQIKDVVYFDLDVQQSVLLERLHPQKRRSLKKAGGNNLAFSNSWAHYPEFKKLYQASMCDKAADDFYHFSPTFFDELETLAQRFKTNNEQNYRVRLNSVLHHGAVISSAIFLCAGDTVEYFLGANAAEARDVHSSAWLLWQSALQCREEGYKRYVLGGGLSADDELFRFKKQLSPLTAPYFIGRRIFNADAYEAIKVAYARESMPSSCQKLQNPPLFFYRD